MTDNVPAYVITVVENAANVKSVSTTFRIVKAVTATLLVLSFPRKRQQAAIRMTQ